MAGYANLDRVKQGLWDAFNGTGQPTTETGLGIMIDEIGWQVRVASSAPDSPYIGVENVPVTTEAKQATIYGQLVRSAECDPTLKDLFFLPFIDETSLTGFQSGLLRADGSERPSYTTVTNAIAATGGRCIGRRVVWKHARTVLGAKVFFHGLAVPKCRVEAARVGLRRPYGRGRTVRRDRRAREPVEARHRRRAHGSRWRRCARPATRRPTGRRSCGSRSATFRPAVTRTAWSSRRRSIPLESGSSSAGPSSFASAARDCLTSQKDSRLARRMFRQSPGESETAWRFGGPAPSLSPGAGRRPTRSPAARRRK